MRWKIVLAALGALLVGGCDQPESGSKASAASLNTKVAALEKRDSDLRLKMQLALGSDSTPLEDFFASPEFWESSYDSSEADCARRCARENTLFRKACAEKPKGLERQQCYDRAAANIGLCVGRCS